MRIDHFALISLLAVLASAGDGGCFGNSGDDDDDRPPATLDGGLDLLDVRGRTLGTGPFVANQTIHLAADASGGVPPYRFYWRSPAITVDPELGYGEVTAGQDSFEVTVQVLDAKREIATDTLTIDVASGVAVLEIEIDGPGKVEAGALGRCERERCGFGVMLHDEIALTAVPTDDRAAFAGWSECSTSTSASITVRVDAVVIRCAARFVIGAGLPTCDAVPTPSGPTATVLVRPSISEPPFPKIGDTYYVPRNVHVAIDGTRSRTEVAGGLGYQWSATWDPLSETPASSVPFFSILTPGFPDERAEAYLTVTDACGRTATATATYVTE